jgi:hypothetical protein
MDFDFKRLTECYKPFFGIIPCKATYPMGWVSLPVTFSTEENFRTEYLSFEVTDFKSLYQAILGRPMLARFMAITHYTYLVLKMSAPHGVLTFYSDLIVSFKCNNKALEIATTNTCIVSHGRRGQEGHLDRPHHPGIKVHQHRPGCQASDEEGLSQPCRPGEDGGHR